MNRKGFTLIELLVVISVLALLASIVFSNLGGAREGARISNALSFQSQTHSLLGSDLVGWWNFNEGLGTTARDISGYDNHGTIVGATYVGGVPGTGGTALSFNGSSDYITTPYIKDIDNRITIMVWINPQGGGSREISNQHQWDGGPWTGWRFRQSSTSINFKLGDGTSTAYELSAGSIEYAVWNHVVGVWDGTNIIIYINGIEANRAERSFTYLGNTGSHSIGKYAGSAYFFYGLIDDVRIYSRALTASEIQIIYTQTKDKYLANE